MTRRLVSRSGERASSRADPRSVRAFAHAPAHARTRRTDLQQGSPADLYDGVHARVLALHGDTALFPAHDYKGRNVTCVRDEELFNPRLTKDKAAFCDLMDNLGLAYPKKLDVAVPANMVCGIQDD